MQRQFISLNPFTKQIQKTFDFIPTPVLEQKIQQSSEGYQQYKKTTYKERSNKLLALAQNLEQNVDYYAQIITQEIGKPIGQSKGEVLKSIQHCKYYATNMERFLKQERVKTESKNSGVIYQPIGVIHLMIPFNFPFWLTFKSGIPILSAGNTVLMRNADSSPILGQELEALFKKSGFDNNEFLNVYTEHSQLDQILGNKAVQGVSFTGSSQAGKIIAQTAGKHLKKQVLELGGSDPFIVCIDADVELAADLAVKSRLNNCGQVCISAKRFLINHNVYDLFVQKVLEKIESVKSGNPMDPATGLGPMAREDLKTNIENQVQRGIDAGAKILYNRDVSDMQGHFYGPVVAEINDLQNPLLQEEIFGPVFAIYKVKNDEEAIQIANSSDYGLGGAVFSKDEKRADGIAKQLEVGMVYINDMTKSDSRLPSGGVKSSGYGRECSDFGIKEFTNIKAYYYG